MTEITTHDLRAMLAEKYKAPEFAFLEEVNSGTGANRGRSADAIAMSLWPSRGLHLIGFELKISRQDWLKEKETPAKADAIARYCDFWYLVVANKEIVQNGELPAAWGLIVPRGDKLIIAKEADKLEPLPIDRKFLAALLRRSSESERKTFDIELARAREQARKDGYEHGEWRAKSEAAQWKRQYEELQASLKSFEEKSGLKVTQYDGARLGEELREYQIKKGNVQYMDNQLRQIKETAEKILVAVDRNNGKA